MTFILFLILLFFSIPYIGRLLLRLFSWYIRRKVVRQQQQAYEQMFGGARQQQREQRGSGWTGDHRSASSSASSYSRSSKGKRIDPSVGEYVDYEEIECASRSTESTDTETTFNAESQIVDAEWEDIK
ncbi:MAG: DUF4834 family protein [Paramuribaculum sp.]|nr:DUF4834 family protein [Candidatus Amulumruptor sp.]MDE6588475.1 DUF4834 family protein [Paramuribaculum sp.]MDE7237888.1 DUF4834 family protein [Paramuribaculum sp.]